MSQLQGEISSRAYLSEDEKYLKRRYEETRRREVLVIDI
jgi:hypothetical protein